MEISLRSSWTGSIAFGMVTCPVRLYGTVKSRSVAFNRVHQACNTRIKQPSYCPTCEVQVTDLAKGIEVADKMIVITDEDMENLPVRTDKEIQISHFVPAAEVDQLLVSDAYYCVPDYKVKAGQRAFALLREALNQTGMAALGKYASRAGKESPVAVTVHDNKLLIQRLHWPDEILGEAHLNEFVDDVEVDPEELALAVDIVGSMTADVEVIREYEDDYRVALENLIDSKLAGVDPEAPQAKPKEAKDMMAALKQSVEALATKE